MKNVWTIFVVCLIVCSSRPASGAPQPPEVTEPSPAVVEQTTETPIRSAFLTDRVEVTFRTGPGIEYRILAMLPLGQRVDILQAQDQWSKIRINDGREGWVSNRFIGREVPGYILYDDLKRQFDQLSADYALLEEETVGLREQNQELQNKIESGVSVPHGRLNQLLEENRRLKRMADQEFLKWFLAGAGVLLMGFLIGCRVCREKRRSYFK